MKKSKNVLDMIPIRNEKIHWEMKENQVILTINRDRAFDRLMHKLFKTPLKTTVELEEFGSFVWQKCDGSHTINDIANHLEEQFGEKARPVLERLVLYMKSLRENNFIHLN
ncbi:MAG: PqqD family protein [Epulopiscium sp.]|nr:PqqD family protein [Candidatus Epulonipiscium sp.]